MICKYTKKQIEELKEKYRKLNYIISEMDLEYDRHFTLDGHLIGSIGEVLAAYYYGIELATASYKTHDGKTEDGKNVQIKITQRKSIVIKDEYLLVLFLTNQGDILEIYNGPGSVAFEVASKKDGYNHRHCSINRLSIQSNKVETMHKIKQKHQVKKYESKDSKKDRNNEI